MKGALALKLSKILGEIGKVEKSGRNDFHRYDYVTENDLVYAVRGRLAEANVFVFTSVESQHAEVITSGEGDSAKSSLLTTVTTKHTFVDGDSGESFSVLSQGQGSDNGDKGGYKAITGAMKYFIYKNFMIPTGDDPEADGKTDERAAAGGASKRPVSTASTARKEPPLGKPVQSLPPRTATTERELDEGGHVRRETSNVNEREEFEGGKWAEVKIHFGSNYKGMKLGELSPAQLKGWLNWQPKPYNGTINPADVRLRTALDVAAAEQQ